VELGPRPKSLALHFLRSGLHFVMPRSTLLSESCSSIFRLAASADKKHAFPPSPGQGPFPFPSPSPPVFHHVCRFVRGNLQDIPAIQIRDRASRITLARRKGAGPFDSIRSPKRASANREIYSPALSHRRRFDLPASILFYSALHPDPPPPSLPRLIPAALTIPFLPHRRLRCVGRKRSIGSLSLSLSLSFSSQSFIY